MDLFDLDHNLLSIIIGYLLIADVGVLDVAISCGVKRIIFLQLLQSKVFKTLIDKYSDLHVQNFPSFWKWLNLRRISTEDLFVGVGNEIFVAGRPEKTYADVQTIYFHRIIDISAITYIIPKCSALRFVTFFRCAISADVIQELRNSSKLTAIFFLGPDDPTDSIPIQLTGPFPNLEILHLTDCSISFPFVGKDLESIYQECPKLVELSIENCHSLTFSDIISNAKNPSMKSLNIGNLGGIPRLNDPLERDDLEFTDTDIHSLILKYSNIKTIGLSKLFLLKDGDLLLILGSCMNIENLDISYCTDLTSESFQQIRGLHSLNVSGTTITSEDLVKILVRSPHMRNLSLGCICDDGVLFALGDRCPLMRKLIANQERKGIHNTLISVDGLLKFFGGCQALEHFQLTTCKCSYTSSAWNQVAACASSCKWLTVFVLSSQTSLPELAILSFVRLCPKLHHFGVNFGHDVDILRVCRSLSRETNAFRDLKYALLKCERLHHPSPRQVQSVYFSPYAMTINGLSYSADETCGKYLISESDSESEDF